MSFDSDSEHAEEVDEAKKIIELSFEALLSDPELFEKIHNMHTKDVTHVCILCLKKREFVQCVQFLGLHIDLQSGKHLGYFMLTCALRTPATALKYLDDISDAAQELFDWCADQVLPEDQRTIGKPAWYPLDTQEWDGHE